MGSGAWATAAGAALVFAALLGGQTSADRAVGAPVPAAAPSGRVEYGWPTGAPGRVVNPFVAPPERWAAGHRGADLAMVTGDDVHVAGDGVVAFAGKVAGRGVVSVDHADGVRTTYEPVAAVVGRGERVRAAQVIGTLEAHGHHCAPDACLHWGARRGADEYLDPLRLLADETVIRLLPEH